VGHYDLSYRSLFSFPKMVEGLFREFVKEPWVEKLDFETLQRVNASYVSEELKSREGDLVWKLRRRDGRPVFVYLLIEHQSKVDRFMALRLMVYIALLYQDLLKQGELTPDGLLPLVIPLVLYNGEVAWWAPEDLADLIERLDDESEAYVPRLRYRVIDEGRYSPDDLEARDSVAAQVFWLEQSREKRKLVPGARRLLKLLGGPGDEALRRAVVAWVSQVLVPRRGDGEPIPETLSPEELEAMLEKRVEEWNRQLREEGRILGRQEGRKEGRLEGRQEGRQEGRLEGRREEGAAFLLRLLERKFGQLDSNTRNLVQGADPDRLLDWGERVLDARRLEDVFEN
jgi:hypothetical protein